MIVIGKFKENYNDDRLPSIFSAIHDEPPEGKEKILRYMKGGRKGAVAPGYLHDRVANAAIITPVSYNDGVYAWRSDVVFYFEHYNIDLPDDFIRHVLKNSK